MYKGMHVCIPLFMCVCTCRYGELQLYVASVQEYSRHIEQVQFLYYMFNCIFEFICFMYACIEECTYVFRYLCVCTCRYGELQLYVASVQEYSRHIEPAQFLYYLFNCRFEFICFMYACMGEYTYVFRYLCVCALAATENFSYTWRPSRTTCTTSSR